MSWGPTRGQQTTHRKALNDMYMQDQFIIWDTALPLQRGAPTGNNRASLAGKAHTAWETVICVTDFAMLMNAALAVDSTLASSSGDRATTMTGPSSFVSRSEEKR